eukprot:UN04228
MIWKANILESLLKLGATKKQNGQIFSHNKYEVNDFEILFTCRFGAGSCTSMITFKSNRYRFSLTKYKAAVSQSS